VAASAAVLAVLWSVTLPAEPRLRLCGFYWLTGRPCPLCGLTRAVFALAKGHWAEALHFNALSPIGFMMLLSLFWTSSLGARLWTARLWTVGIAAFAGYGVWRLVV
jgi:hypothetical protein